MALSHQHVMQLKQSSYNCNKQCNNKCKCNNIQMIVVNKVVPFYAMSIDYNCIVT